MSKWGKLLIILMVFTVIVACSNGNNGNNGNEGNKGTANVGGEVVQPTDNKPEEPIEISWLSFDFPEEDGTVVQKYLEEKFNVKINNIRIDRANWNDQLNVRIASGETPDMWLLWGIKDVSTYESQDLLLELPVDEIKANIPGLAKLIDEKDPGSWANGIIEGKSYGVPIPNLDGGYPFLTVYNADWLKKIGYDAPPETMEQLEDVLYKFRNDDPDNNGKKDTFGITDKAALSSFTSIFGAFDVHPDYWMKDDSGKLAFGMTTENAREAFKLLNKWFKDDVLDPEFITAVGRTEFENGRSGITGSAWYYYSPSKVTAFPTVVGKQVAAPGYIGKSMAWGLTSNYIGMGIDVEKTPGKKEKIYEILNAMFSDEEVIKYLVRGEEGVHHDVVDGRLIMKPEVTEKAKSLGFGNYYGLLTAKSEYTELLRTSPEDLAWRSEVTEGIPMIFDEAKFYLPTRGDFPDLVNMQNEYYIKFITGEVDLDAGFDNFVDLWKKAGGEKLTDEANQLYLQLHSNG